MLFTVICFAIPILSTAYTVVKDYGYIEGQKDMPKKKPGGTWRKRDGNLIPIDRMTDTHLANSIRMVVRQWTRMKGSGIVPTSLQYGELYYEAKKRNFIITLLTTPITLNGKTEYAEILIPTPPSKIKAGFFPSELDSRSQE